MPRRVAVNSLNASTIDIINTIRANASPEYQDTIPAITKATEIPKVGEALYGYPALANQFISALVNRIAAVRVKSATFNNAYANLKKGYLEFGETVEEVFVNITKAREFSAEKAEKREFKRSMPDVKTAMHTMNWRVQYPVTIQDEDLRTAFLSMDGVQDLIAKIVNAVSVAAEYDEFLLFKYMLIKSVAHGKVYFQNIKVGDFKDAAAKFRSVSNMLTFMQTKFNNSHVHNVTSRDEQCIFMPSDYNAQFDVNVLASAFNMEKTDFMGKLYLIDDFTTFDNDRFAEIRANCDMIEEVTAEELAAMTPVKAIIVDPEWFQIYDNNNKFTEDYVASGMYWNYFYNVWKTVSSSPFSNIVAFVESADPIAMPAQLTVNITDKSKGAAGTAFTVIPKIDVVKAEPRTVRFEQTEDLTKLGVAVHPYGAYIFPTGVTTAGTEKLGLFIQDTHYTATASVDAVANVNVGDSITFKKG